MGIAWTLTVGLPTGVLCLVLAAVIELYRRPKSRFHTVKTLLYAFITQIALVTISVWKWRILKRDVTDFIKAQERFVLRQIRDNEDTEYGRDHQFCRIHSLAEFRRRHPLTTYSHYEPYLKRAENGHVTAILGRAKLQVMVCSSGTTGKAKHIPVSSGFMASTLGVASAIHGFHPNFKRLRGPLYKEMQVLCRPKWRYTPSGVPIGSLSALYTRAPLQMASWATPIEAHVVETETEALYVSLLFGLRDRHLMRIDGGFAAGLFNMLQYMEDNWRLLVTDIRTGRLNDQLAVSDEQRRAINAQLCPDTERARELQAEFQKGFDSILPRIFPKLETVSALSSGTSMTLYKEKCLPYLGHLRILSIVYGSSEGMFGVNTRPAGQNPAYMLIPSIAFVEFLPVDETGTADEGQQPLLADQVQVGELYELVITNCSGFYRYRMGDVVKVVDFYCQAPCVDFQFRAGQMLNVHMEKLSESNFFRALRTAVSRWPAVSLREFTSAESLLDPRPRAGPPYYLVFLELETGEATSSHTDMIDAVLCEQNETYNYFRVKGSIGPMKVMTVSPGTFASFRQLLLKTTTAVPTQFKQPRVLRAARHVEFFMEHVISK